MSDDRRVSESAGRLPGIVTATIAVVALILIVGIVLLSLQFDRDRDLYTEVSHSYENRSRIQSLLSMHQDIETGQRGYVLTGNEVFLEPYRRAASQVRGAITTLRAEALAPALLPELEEVSDLTRLKLEFAETTVRLVASGRRDEAQQLIASGRGKAIMDEMRLHVAHMDAIVKEQLELRSERAERSRLRTQWSNLALQIILILLLTYAAIRASRSIAAEHEAAQRLQALSARQEAIFDAATDGMITHDEHGVIQNLNPAVTRMYGYRPDELIGRNVASLFELPPEQGSLERFLRRLASDPEGKASKIQEFGARRSDGGTFHVDVATSHVPLPTGSCFVAVIRDASERKRMERMKSEFVSTVSHELRTPLTSIAGSMGLIAGGAAGEIPERAKRLIEIAHSNSRRLVRLINDILDIEKIESGRMDFDIGPVPLRAAAEQAMETNKTYAEEYGVTFILEPGGEDAVVLADSDRLMQVLTNLLSNAAKFSPKGEQVTVRLVPGKKRHRFTVSDRGPGISAEFRSRIFDKFAQGDASDARQKGGTGLGLSIVREIVSQMDGSVSFDSEPGQGTSFHVDLPAAPPKARR